MICYHIEDYIIIIEVVLLCVVTLKNCVLHYARNDSPNIFLWQNITCIQFNINDGWNIFLLQQYIRYIYIGFHILWESGEDYIPYLCYVEGYMCQTVVHGNLCGRNIFSLCVWWHPIVLSVEGRRLWTYIWIWRDWEKDTTSNDLVTSKLDQMYNPLYAW